MTDSTHFPKVLGFHLHLITSPNIHCKTTSHYAPQQIASRKRINGNLFVRTKEMTVKKCSRLCLNPLVLNLQKYRSFSLHLCPQHTKGLRMLPMDSRSNSALVFRFHFALSMYTIRGKSGSLLPCLARNSAPAAIFISHDKSCLVQNIDRMFNIHLKLVD